ncbi:hypothetical protein ATANTOWER_021446 [Ataeniobius toweri]|uniref:DUF6729 domain-containing protein n=1 Tax=Ataeniobius toweri TaxID=208326 RepID=A0ABU7C0A4_9TELE|nr:hypothetical protein [Ataeniobius toweri]
MSLWTPRRSDLSTTCGGLGLLQVPRWRKPWDTFSTETDRGPVPWLLLSPPPPPPPPLLPPQGECVSAPRPVSRTASHFLAFVSTRRSLSGVEMQAALKKLSSSTKPAIPAASSRTSRPALSSKTPVEPGDEELVRATADTEKSSGAQACPVSATSSTTSLPPRDAGVSVQLGDPTDEELLEATAEQGCSTRDPPEPATVEDAHALFRQDHPPPADGAEMLPESWRAALSPDQQEWIGRTLFGRDSTGRPRLTADLNLWWYPPQPRPVYNQPPASPGPFFACRLFLWMPHRIWCLQLTCPQPSCTGSMTKAGLYRTIWRVLDIDGWYLMATEYLECRRCKRKVGGWSQVIVGQLPPTYSCLFPAVLTYKLSCDQKVVAQLRSRTLGNSATQLYNTLREQHTESWMRRSIHYLGVCEQFLSLGSVSKQSAPPPPMPPVPSPVWLLTVYGYDVVTRLDEYKARITSTFGSILKMDSTKKVTKKLASAASDTAAWVTNVGNEYGQVLMSILACSEGSEGLDAMAAGLMGRY